LATVVERVTLVDEGPRRCVLPAMTSASRISDLLWMQWWTSTGPSDLDATTRLKCVTMEALGDRIAVGAAALGGSLRDGEIIEVGGHGRAALPVRWSEL
jgi:hypothetical protein